MRRCEINSSAAVVNPKKEIWEQKLFCLLTSALMGDPFTFTSLIIERHVYHPSIYEAHMNPRIEGRAHVKTNVINMV